MLPRSHGKVNTHMHVEFAAFVCHHHLQQDHKGAPFISYHTHTRQINAQNAFLTYIISSTACFKCLCVCMCVCTCLVLQNVNAHLLQLTVASLDLAFYRHINQDAFVRALIGIQSVF